MIGLSMLTVIIAIVIALALIAIGFFAAVTDAHAENCMKIRADERDKMMAKDTRTNPTN